MEKKKLLWISYLVPYDKVGHAGGKVHNHYIKYFNKMDGFDIRLISFYREEEKNAIDLDKYGIDNELFSRDYGGIKGILRKVINMESKLSPWNRYKNCVPNTTVSAILKTLKKYKKQGYNPDVILLEWTEIVILLPKIKTIFPKAKIVSMEEDVSFLRFERILEGMSEGSKKESYAKKVHGIKAMELKCLEMSDLVLVNNPKDRKLIVDNGIKEDKIKTLVPYFDNMNSLEKKKHNNNIVFYGAMSREENYLSAIWFIENVMPLLDEKLSFVVVGGNPHKRLLECANDRVKIVGFVENVGDYFADCLCMASPLLLGAGIKIKVLEAMSGAVPVLTNEIGIEGIPAENGKDYIFCDKPEEYAAAIAKLSQDETFYEMISANARKFMDTQYNLEANSRQIYNSVMELS